MTVERAVFFDAVRPAPFGGRLNPSQVSGTETILDAWDAKHANDDLRWLAYILATAFHETAGTMQPIREYGLGRGHPYGQPDPTTGRVYYGRGYVQLTWRFNYTKQSRRLGVDLVQDPDKALIPAYAATILIEGMLDGDFTGSSLRNFFGPATNNPIGARRIINGADCAAKIAEYHNLFRAALDAGTRAGARIA